MLAEEKKLSGLKMQYDALITEYKMVREHVSSSRQLQGQLDTIALTALGISIPAVWAILSRPTEFAGTILFIPILFFAITFVQLRYERILFLASIYADSELRPGINQLLSSLVSSKVQVLQWEFFLSQGNQPKNLIQATAAILSHTILPFGVALGVVTVYIYSRVFLLGQISLFEPWLWALNTLMFVSVLVYVFRLAKIRNDFLKKHNPKS